MARPMIVTGGAAAEVAVAELAEDVGPDVAPAIAVGGVGAHRTTAIASSRAISLTVRLSAMRRP